MTRVRRSSLLFALLLAVAALVPSCGLVWWGGAAVVGYAVLAGPDDGEDDVLDTDPVLTSLSVYTCEETGGRAVTLNGENFQPNCAVRFGSQAALNQTFVNAWMVQVTAPATPTGTAGTLVVDVTLSNPDGKSAVLPGAFTYVDTLAPAAVTDLAVTPGAANQAVVSFTAPGDNGPAGTATSYTLRFAATPITTDGAFNSATPVPWASAPQPGGTAETATVALNWSVGYLALKTTDDAGNVSLLSNTVQFDPFPPDAAANLTVVPGTQRGRFVLSWTTTADDGSASTSGPVTAYRVKTSRAPILSASQFDAADDAVFAAAAPPLAPGSTETRAVDLPENMEGWKYYFSLRMEDDAGNLSAPSNCVAEEVYVTRFQFADGFALPNGRHGAAVVYDPDQRRLLAYGGRGWNGTASNYIYFNDVFALDLDGNGFGTWTQLVPADLGGQAPTTGRYDAAAVWDPLNHRMVFFGGRTSAGDVSTTHFIDFAPGGPAAGTWGLVPAANSPTARSGASAVYDPFRRRMVVLAGRTGNSPNSSVHFLQLPAGSAPIWSMVTPIGGTFSARWGAAALFLPKNDGVLVYGGHASTTQTLGDLRLLNFTSSSWQLVTTTAGTQPPVRGDAAFGFDPFNQRFLVAGGLQQTTSPPPTLLNDAWALELAGYPTVSWRAIPTAASIMSGVWGAEGCYDAVNQRLHLFGGALNDAGSLNNSQPLSLPTRSLEVETGWLPLQTTGVTTALQRSKCGIVLHPSTKEYIIFGGESNSGLKSDTWALNLSTGNWSLVPGAGPGARRGSLYISDPFDRRVLVFGGYYSTTTPFVSNQLWHLSNSGTYSWSQPAQFGSGTASEGAAGCYDANNHGLVVFGGHNGTVPISNLDILDLATMTWSNHGPQGGAGLPGALSYACGVYDPGQRAMIVFGGNRGASLSSDVWLLHLDDPSAPSWTRVTTNSGPVARQGACGYYDAMNRRAVFFGGEGSGATPPLYSDCWALTLNGHGAAGRATGLWVQLNPRGTAPSARGFAACAFDPDRLRGLVFGGDTGAAWSGETFELVPPAPELPALFTAVPAGTAPAVREYHSAVLDKPGEQMIVFGGRQGTSTFLGDVFALQKAREPGAETWFNASTVITGSGPGNRAGHAAFLYPYSTGSYCLIALGASSASTYHNDTHLLFNSGNTWQWNPNTLPLNPVTAPPTARAYGAYGFDMARIRLVVFGGEFAGGTVTDELWTLTPRFSASPALDLTWTPITPATTNNPPARKNASAYSLDEHLMVVFGGTDASGQELNDMWLLGYSGPSGSEVWYWARVPEGATAPPARHSAAAFARTGLAGGFLLGGSGASVFNDFWSHRSLGNSTGEYLQPGLTAAGTTIPTGFTGSSAVYDEKNQRALVFGGRDASASRNALYAVEFFQPVRR